MRDMWSVLQQRWRTDPGGPLVTFLAAETGERTELSAASLLNAAAKIGNAVRDEFELEAGGIIGIHLPPHWQRACWLAGAWTAGCLVVPDGEDVDLVVAGPQQAAGLCAAGMSDVAVVSLHPFGLPIRDPLPPGAFDVTAAVRQQPDAYLHDPPGGGSAALALDGQVLDQAEMLARAAALAQQYGLESGGRLLVDDRTPEAEAWLAALAVPIAVSGSVVIVDGDGESCRDQERITALAR